MQKGVRGFFTLDDAEKCGVLGAGDDEKENEYNDDTDDVYLNGVGCQ